jgi:myo-inositol 2-dehydrogenase / D-chiro-inositol 1-dehydrogenase
VKSQSMSTNLRVCVVGASRMGADHIARLTAESSAPRLRLWPTSTFRAQRRRSKRSRRPWRCAASHRLWTKLMSNGVLVATPGFLHEEVLLEVGERDLPILCEKPLTPEEAGPWTCGQAR